MSLVQRFAQNTRGRDFVVGDVHGCFDYLRAMLEHVQLDEVSDRLFCVGDLGTAVPSPRRRSTGSPSPGSMPCAAIMSRWR